MAYRNYSDDDKATAIAYFSACGNLAMAARDCKVPMTTLERWVKNPKLLTAPPPELVTEKKIDLANAFGELAEKCVTHAIRNHAESSAYHATGMAEKAVLTMRLLREQATSITATAPQTDEEKTARINELAAKHGLKLVA